MESLTVEDIWLTPHYASSSYDNIVQLSVYNVGKVDMKVNAIYVNGLRLQTDFDPTQIIKVGEYVTITANSNPGSHWDSGQTYTFRIVTQSGSKFDVNYTAP